MIFAGNFTSVALIWPFMMAFPLAYDIFRKDPDSTARQTYLRLSESVRSSLS